MPHPRAAQLFLVIAFLATLASAGLVQLAVETARGQAPQALALFTQRPTAANLRAYENQLETESWLARQLRPHMVALEFGLFGKLGAKGLSGLDGWRFYRPEIEFLTTRPTPAEQAQPEDAIRAIADFRDQLEARGIKLLVVPVPNKASVHPDRASQRASRPQGVLAAGTRRLFAGLAAGGVEVVDLFGLFAKALDAPGSVPPPMPYLMQDSHWSPVGAAQAARAVAERLLSLGWVRPGEVRFERRTVPVPRVGDVVRMLESAPLERWLGAEEVGCEQIIRAGDGTVYRDDPDARILVLGDSFLRIYETDEPGGAGFIAHLAAALRQPVTSLVSDGGASTMVRQELARRPGLLARKQVVVWEFVERDLRYGAEGWSLVSLPAGGKGDFP